MLCYLTGMEPYYIQCIKDGLFKLKIAEGADKPEAQWTSDERRVVNQDQRFKSIIISCLPDDIMESVISCEIAKDTWTDLVHSFEGPYDTKENRIMDLKLKYQTFKAKSSETLSQTYTHYKTLLNELANDGVTLSKHEINVGFEILRYKKALITTPSDSPISTAFFSNNIVQDFQENSDNEADERTSEEYLRDMDIEFHERALLANSKHFIKRKNNFSSQKANQDTECYKCNKKGHFARDCFSKTSESSYKSPPSYSSSVSKGFQPKFTLKLIQSSQYAQSSQAKPKAQKDYNTEYKKLKAKLALLEASPPISQSSKPFNQRTKALLIKHSIGMRKKYQMTRNELKSSSRIHHPKNNAKDNPFVPASLDYDHEMVPKSKYWVERLNPHSKLPNFNTGRILVLKGASPSSEVMTLIYQDHSLRERSGLGTMKHTKPETQESSNKYVSGPVTVSNPKPVTSSVPTEVKTND
ncbi:retrovirus-related pol polyprotein from transposon TNT 1-94 [Tanacetum coccineum]